VASERSFAGVPRSKKIRRRRNPFEWSGTKRLNGLRCMIHSSGRSEPRGRSKRNVRV
jgi:hypothetical protein